MELKVTDYTIDADGVATVRFNRPGRGNSWTSRMNAEYRHIMALLDDDLTQFRDDQALRNRPRSDRTGFNDMSSTS